MHHAPKQPAKEAAQPWGTGAEISPACEMRHTHRRRSPARHSKRARRVSHENRNCTDRVAVRAGRGHRGRHDLKACWLGEDASAGPSLQRQRLLLESAKLTDFGASFWLLEDRSRKRRPRPLPATKSPIARDAPRGNRRAASSRVSSRSRRPALKFRTNRTKTTLARKHPPVQGAFRGSSPHSQIDICQLTRIDFQCQAIRPCGADETPVRSLCSRMVCTRRGMIGADVRPDWGPHVNKRHV